MNGDFNASEVNGKIVFVGDTRLAGSDVFNTPFTVARSEIIGKKFEEKIITEMPGIEVHANILATMLDANEDKSSPRYARIPGGRGRPLRGICHRARIGARIRVLFSANADFHERASFYRRGGGRAFRVA